MREELLELYRRWREWTEAEGEAIRTWNWPRVERIQADKEELVQTIITTAERLRAECLQVGSGSLQLEEELRGVVNELVTLEARNQEQLAAQRQQASAQATELNNAVHQLRQIKRAYAAGSEARWQSYS